jgi:hypothetical protein
MKWIELNMNLVLIFFILFTLFIVVSALYQGIRGLFGKDMLLILMRHSNLAPNKGTIQKGRAYFWGFVYICFGLLGIGLFIVFLVSLFL